MKLRIKTMIWNIRNKKNNQSEQHKEKTILKNEDSVSSLWYNFKKSNLHVTGVPEEEKEQEFGNLFEKKMK